MRSFQNVNERGVAFKQRYKYIYSILIYCKKFDEMHKNLLKCTFWPFFDHNFSRFWRFLRIFLHLNGNVEDIAMFERKC